MCFTLNILDAKNTGKHSTQNKNYRQSSRRPVSHKPTGAPLTPPYVRVTYTAVQTPSSNFKEVIKERFVASLFETVERDCGNEYWATRDSPATHAAVSPLPCCTFGNTKPGKVYRLAAWFLPVVPDTIPQTVANPSIQRFEFPVYRSLFEVVQPSTHQQV